MKYIGIIAGIAIGLLIGNALVGLVLAFVFFFCCLVYEESVKLEEENNVATSVKDDDLVEFKVESHYAGGNEYSIRYGKHVDSTFHPAAANLTVHDFLIPGLVYTSDVTLKEDYNYSPGVIGKPFRVSEGPYEELFYSPSYQQFSPKQRYHYLKWLSEGGVSNEEVGFAFVYLCGFERYVLADAANDDESVRNSNLDSISKELIRLLDVFEDQKSFQGYGRQLLACIYIQHWPSRIDELLAVAPVHSIAVRYKLAAHVAQNEGELLPWDWALEWATYAGLVKGADKKPKAYSHLSALFRHVYERKYPKGGMPVPVNKKALTIDIWPSCGNIDGFEGLDYPRDWVCPADLSGPEKKLRLVMEEVLPAYRQLKRSDWELTAKTIAKLPAGFAAGASSEVQDFVVGLSSLGSQVDGVSLKEVAEVLRADVPEGKLVGKSIITSLFDACQAIGWTMVPSPHLDYFNMRAEEAVVLYKGVAPASLSQTGAHIALKVRLSVWVAMADELLHENEEAYIKGMIDEHIDDKERLYLENFFRWLITRPTSGVGLKASIEGLSDKQKLAIGGEIVQIALADGSVDNKEMVQLCLLYTSPSPRDQRGSRMPSSA